MWKLIGASVCLLILCILLNCECVDPRSELGSTQATKEELQDVTSVSDTDITEKTTCKSPGSTKPAEIPKSQLKYLFFVVHGRGMIRTRYSYWDSKKIISDPAIDLKRKTIVVALGYLDSTNFMIANMFANEYRLRSYNVILIDYQRFATVHYYLASRLMRPVGRRVAEVLYKLTRLGLQPDKLELIGFSLGGQTVSYIAKNFRELSGKNITSITSLEPSGPCFRSLEPKDRLDASDADFVQVVHTNIDGYGMANRMGHVDFYVNGGEYQPSDLTMYPCTTTCSHFRVLPLWLAVMLFPDKFVGLQCDSIQEARDDSCYGNGTTVTNVMGPNIDTKVQGIFYLATRKGFPYYLGEDGLKPEAVSWKRVSDVNDGNDTLIYT